MSSRSTIEANFRLRQFMESIESRKNFNFVFMDLEREGLKQGAEAANLANVEGLKMNFYGYMEII